MVAEANRGVVFTLKARTDASVGKEFSQVSDLASLIQDRLNRLKFGAPDATQFQSGAEKILAAHAAMEAKMNGITEQSEAKRASARAAKKVAGFAAGVGPTSETNQKEIDAARAKIEHLQRLADLQQQKDDEREKAAAEKKAARDKQSADRQAARDQAAAEKREAKKKDELKKLIALEEKYWAEVEEKQEHAQSEAAKAAEVAQRKVQESLVGTKNALLSAADQAANFARGLAFLHLVGEDDLDKLRDSLLQIQGAFYAVRGGIGVFRELSDAARKYTEYLNGVAVAERAVAASRAAGGAVNALGAAGGAAGLAGGVGTVGGAAGVASIAAPIAAVLGTLLAGRAIYKQATGQRDEVGEAVANASGVTSAVGHAMTQLARANRALGIDRFDLTGNQQLFTGAYDTQQRTDRLESARTRRQIEEEMRSDRMRTEGGAGLQQIDLAARRASFENMVNPFAKPEEQLASQQKQLAAERQAAEEQLRIRQAEVNRTKGEGGASTEEHLEAKRQELFVEERIAGLNEREIDLSNQQRRIDIDAAKQKLELMTRQLAVAKQQVSEARAAAEAARQKVEGTQRSLADLNAVEKAELIQAMKDLQAGKEIGQQAAGLIDQHGDEAAKGALQEQRRKRGEKTMREIQQAVPGAFMQEEMQASAAKEQEDFTRRQQSEIEKRLEDQRREAEKKNEGTKFKIDLDNNVQIEIVGESKADAARRKKLTDEIKAFLQRQQKQFDADLEQALAEVDRQTSAKLQRAAQTKNAK